VVDVFLPQTNVFIVLYLFHLSVCLFKESSYIQTKIIVFAVQVLYSKTNPELLQYIYLLAPISVLILNPIGFIMLEIDKNWK